MLRKVETKYFKVVTLQDDQLVIKFHISTIKTAFLVGGFAFAFPSQLYSVANYISCVDYLG